MALESLTFNLKEALKAKDSLESRLKEKRQKRKNIENILEKVNSELAQVRDRHTKMTETKRIAQHKVAEMQAQSDSLEASNKDKRNTLELINQKTKDLQEQRRGNMNKFEEELSKTAKVMFEAKDFYSDENLKMKIEESKEKYNQEYLRGKQLDKEVASVTECLYHTDQIDQKAVMDIFMEEQKHAIKCLESLKAEIQSTKNPLSKQGDRQQ